MFCRRMSRLRLGLILWISLLIVHVAPRLQAMAPLPASGSNVNLAYEGDALPTAVGWTGTTTNLTTSGSLLLIPSTWGANSVFSPSNVINNTNSGPGTTLEFQLKVTSGHLYFQIVDGARYFQLRIEPDTFTFMPISGGSAVSISHAFTAFTQVRLILAGGNAKIYINGVLKGDAPAGGGTTTGNYLQMGVFNPSYPPVAQVDSIRIVDGAIGPYPEQLAGGTLTAMMEGSTEPVQSPWTQSHSPDDTTLSTDGKVLTLTAWADSHTITSPSGVFSTFASTGSTLEANLEIDSGRLYFVLYDGSKQYQMYVSNSQFYFLNLGGSPATYSFSHDFSQGLNRLRVCLNGNYVMVFVNGIRRIYSAIGSTTSAGVNQLVLMPDNTANPTGRLDYLRIATGQVLPATQPTASPFAERIEYRGNLKVTISPIRQLARHTSSPIITGFTNNSVISRMGFDYRSTDGGARWNLHSAAAYHMSLATLELSASKTLMLDAWLKPTGTGTFEIGRYQSTNRGVSTSQLTSATVNLSAAPGSLYASPVTNHNLFAITKASGKLIGVVTAQTTSNVNDPWKTYAIQSTDDGASWTYLKLIAEKSGISDPLNRLAQSGWPLYYAAEPSVCYTTGNHVVCVMRTTNDETAQDASVVAPATSDFADLSDTVTGDGIHSGVVSLPSTSYFKPGLLNAPLLIATSSDNGSNWTAPAPMEQARGVVPRMAYDNDGILALTYGALSGVPRWGNAVSFSQDHGVTWTDEIVFAPFLTDGTTAITALAPGQFLVFFSCTPPQVHTKQDAHWIGMVTMTVQKL